MRLIDADLLEGQMNKETIHLFNSMYKGYVKALKCVKQQPTAFDVDEIVKKLEDAKNIYAKLVLSVNDDTEKMKYIAKEQAMLVAIGIVKGGGYNDRLGTSKRIAPLRS